MEHRKLICIGCPKGCELTVTIENGGVSKVEGNQCKKGAAYAKKEVTDPTRIVTSTVPVLDGEIPVIPVKTAQEIPKRCVMACVWALRNVKVKAPVEIGDVILHDVAGTGIDVVATKKINQKSLYKAP